MIYKVFYQENKSEAPRREHTHSLYIEAESDVDARSKVTENTPYNVEFIQEMSASHLEYEQEHNPDFEVVSY